MATTFTNTEITIKLDVLTCGNCGIGFGVDEKVIAQRRRDHQTFYCPNGCPRHYPHESTEERYKRLYNFAETRLTHTRDQLESTERSRRAYKGQVTRIRRRVGKGVCPCCNRSFQDLASHMEAKHPDYGSESVTEA
jgi:hypothetical protein